MKKSQLRQIIKEEIKSLLHENTKEVKVGDKLKHKRTGAEMVVTKVSGNNLTTKYTSVGSLPGVKVGDINKTSANLIGKSYELKEEVSNLEGTEAVNEAAELPAVGSMIRLKDDVNLVSLRDLKDKKLKVIRYEKGPVSAPTLVVVVDGKGEERTLPPDYIQPAN